jgi:hypothetical protein
MADHGPGDLTGFLEYDQAQKAPFRSPAGLREVFARLAPRIAGLLFVPAALAAQVRGPVRAPATTVAPNYHTQMLAFERGLRSVSATTDGQGCKVVTITAVAAPQNIQFATGAAGSLRGYSIRAGYAAGQASPSQQTLMAADRCATGTLAALDLITASRGGGGFMLGGYPRDGRLTGHCPTAQCAVYPPPTSWGTGQSYLRSSQDLRVPSAPGLGRVVIRIYAWAVANGGSQYAVFDSTNALTVSY